MDLAAALRDRQTTEGSLGFSLVETTSMCSTQRFGKRGRCVSLVFRPADPVRQHMAEGERAVRQRAKCIRRRRGATAVEFAIVAVPLFLFIFASVEFGRTMMATQSMEEAARAGCRLAVIKGSTTETVEAEIDTMMSAAGILNYTVEIDPVDFESADRWEPVSVIVSANFEDISWLPTPMYLGGMTLNSSSTLPKEAAPGT